MDKIEKYLEKQNKIILEDREKVLISLGLFEKEYAPDGKESYQYMEYDYINGQKKYYRPIPINVTDEEWEQIITKRKQVEEIKERNWKEEYQKSQYSIVKKILPAIGREPKEIQNSAGTLALYVMAWVIGITILICGMNFVYEGYEFLVALVIGSLQIIILHTLARILEYLAEIVSILRTGFIYTETKDKQNKCL